MKKSKLPRSLIISGFFMLTMLLVHTPSAYADALFPILMTYFPSSVFLLPVVIFLEAAIFKRYLRISFKRALPVSFAANGISTLAGAPFPAFAFVQLYRVFALDQAIGRFVMFMFFPGIGIATVLLLYGLTLLVERWVMQRFLPDVDGKTVWRAVLEANIWSYALLIVVTLASSLIWVPGDGKRSVTSSPYHSVGAVNTVHV